MLTKKYITQDWVANATEQEIFDYVAKHLLTQNCQSVKDLGCAYFGEWGWGENSPEYQDRLYCAAGCLLEDTEEVRDFVDKYCEDRTWEELCNMGFVPVNNLKLIDDLRIVHDSSSSQYWKNNLNSIAEEYELNPITEIE